MAAILNPSWRWASLRGLHTTNVPPRLLPCWAIIKSPDSQSWSSVAAWGSSVIRSFALLTFGINHLSSLPAYRPKAYILYQSSFINSSMDVSTPVVFDDDLSESSLTPDFESIPCDEPLFYFSANDNPYDDEEENENELESVARQSVENKRLNRLNRRRWKYKQSRPFAKIPQTDIRREFPIIWVNVWNWCDPVRYKSFLEYFTSRNCINRNCNHPDAEKLMSAQLPYYLPESSHETSIQHYAYVSTVAIDTVCRLLSCKIVRSKQSTKTKIFMELSIQGTKVYDLVIPDQNEQSTTLESSEPDAETVSSSGRKVDASTKLTEVDPRALSKYRVLCDPAVFIDTVGIMVVEVDDFNHYVTSLVYHGTKMTCTPITHQSESFSWSSHPCCSSTFLTFSVSFQGSWFILVRLWVVSYLP